MNKALITRADAKALGLKRYFTGKPCKHGHVAERTMNRICVELNRLNMNTRQNDGCNGHLNVVHGGKCDKEYLIHITKITKTTARAESRSVIRGRSLQTF